MMDIRYKIEVFPVHGMNKDPIVFEFWKDKDSFHLWDDSGDTLVIKQGAILDPEKIEPGAFTTVFHKSTIFYKITVIEVDEEGVRDGRK